MRWPFRYKGEPSDREGKEMAKQQFEVAQTQLEMAQAINRESVEAAHEHRWLLYRNGFGPSTAAALKEPRK